MIKIGFRLSYRVVVQLYTSGSFQTMQTITSLKCLRIENSPRAPWIVLLHGYGANAYDLKLLRHPLDPEKKFNWLFPNAPHQIHSLASEGYSWYPLDIEEFIMQVQMKQFDSIAQNQPEGLEEACFLLGKTLKTLAPSSIILGGFSQGTTLAMEAFLNQSDIKSLLLFSPTLINQKSWEEKLHLKAPIDCFISHGDSDPILPLTLTKRLKNILEEQHMRVNFMTFEGGHEISVSVLEKTREFLSKFSM